MTTRLLWGILSLTLVLSLFLASCSAISSEANKVQNDINPPSLTVEQMSIFLGNTNLEADVLLHNVKAGTLYTIELYERGMLRMSYSNQEFTEGQLNSGQLIPIIFPLTQNDFIGITFPPKNLSDVFSVQIKANPASISTSSGTENSVSSANPPSKNFITPTPGTNGYNSSTSIITKSAKDIILTISDLSSSWQLSSSVDPTDIDKSEASESQRIFTYPLKGPETKNIAMVVAVYYSIEAAEKLYDSDFKADLNEYKTATDMNIGDKSYIRTSIQKDSIVYTARFIKDNVVVTILCAGNINGTKPQDVIAIAQIVANRIK